MKFRPLLKKLALASASLIVAFVLAELIARASEPGPFSFVDHNPNDPDPELDHVHRPGFVGRWDGTWYEINSRGMRGPEWAPTFAANEYRILALGDSCTFGKGVNESDCWPRQLETVMRASVGDALSIRVANAGVNGYSTGQYLKVLRKYGPEVKPQLVLLGYNLNDFPNVVQATDRAIFQGKNSMRARVPTALRDELGRLALFRWMRATYYEMNREKDWAAAEKFARESTNKGAGAAVDKLEAEKQRLKTLVEESRAMGAQVAIFLLPYESQVYLEIFDDSPVQRLRALCDELGVTFVNLADAFRTEVRKSTPPPRLFLRGDRYHPTAAGYRIVADCVIKVLREQSWLPISH
ncbi:MAG: hypothetical protein K8S98_09990 [Planctomycetes bacterium]|nr:hypothetical protein [Planctomycetota bacterium]